MVAKKDMPYSKSTRLPHYDYADAAAHFVTICAWKKQNLFGRISADEMYENKFGSIAHNCWSEIPDHFPNVLLDQFVIMPNHVHGFVLIGERAQHAAPENKTPPNSKCSCSEP